MPKIIEAEKSPVVSTGARSNGLAAILLIGSVSVLAIVLTLRIYTSWKYADDLDQVSGIWAAMASDLLHGTFYRPLFSETLGYGGARYFPLHFVLLGALMHWGNIVTVGHLLDLTVLLLLLCGVYAFLRRYQTPRLYAIALAMLVPAAKSGQLPALTIRSDALPLMFDVWAMVVCLAPEFGWVEVISAAILFSLAFASKETALYALIAVCAAFLLTGRRSDAFRVFWTSLLGFSLVLVAMFLASRGGVFTMMKHVALEGASPLSLLASPLALLAWVRDPGSVAFFVLAGASLLVLPRGRLFELPTIFFVLASAAVGVVLMTPGTTWNHLIDVHVAAVCLFGTWLFREKDQKVYRYGLALLAITACIAVFPSGLDLRRERAQQGVNKYTEAMVTLEGVDKPILAEDAMIPVLAGQRPYIIDAMDIAVVTRKDPSFAEPLEEMLNRQAFGAVVLQFDQHSEDGQIWYRSWAFGPWFIPALNKNYEFRSAAKGLFFYFPRERSEENTQSFLSNPHLAGKGNEQ